MTTRSRIPFNYVSVEEAAFALKQEVQAFYRKYDEGELSGRYRTDETKRILFIDFDEAKSLFHGKSPEKPEIKEGWVYMDEFAKRLSLSADYLSSCCRRGILPFEWVYTHEGSKKYRILEYAKAKRIFLQWKNNKSSADIDPTSFEEKRYGCTEWFPRGFTYAEVSIFRRVYKKVKATANSELYKDWGYPAWVTCDD